jgi:hypothetical protein
MPLTPSQKRKVAGLREISKIACIDFWNVESSNDNNSVKTSCLTLRRIESSVPTFSSVYSHY